MSEVRRSRRMQSGPPAYVEQIPPGVRIPSPPPRDPPPRTVGPPANVTPPPGLYVQVASVVTPQQAIQAGLDLTQRLGAARPPFIRGVKVQVNGAARIRMFAGPLADEASARRLCAVALPNDSCLMQTFPPTPPAPRQ